MFAKRTFLFLVCFLTACFVKPYPDISTLTPIKSKQLEDSIFVNFDKFKEIKILLKVKSETRFKKESFRIAILKKTNNNYQVEIFPSVSGIPLATYYEKDSERITLDSHGKPVFDGKSIFKEYLGYELKASELLTLVLGKFSEKFKDRISFYDLEDKYIGSDNNQEYYLTINREYLLKELSLWNKIVVTYNNPKKYQDLLLASKTNLNISKKNHQLTIDLQYLSME